ACSLKMGALAANAPERTADLLYVFGLDLGIAFQLQDDLLDVFADQEKFGKKIGGDIISNKKTFLLLKALELSDDPTKKELLEWIEKCEFDHQEKIMAVKNIYTKLKIKEITENNIEDFYQSALDVLNEIDVAKETKAEMVALAKMIMSRDH
ncbi:MAG: polyprenyl synthetase family protein, partial [Bacteroidota bacterium]|nr:polyprenyl synthetase family protein [Bacteroidota bacterium]